MVFRAKVCELTDGFLWFVSCLYVGILTSPLTGPCQHVNMIITHHTFTIFIPHYLGIFETF